MSEDLKHQKQLFLSKRKQDILHASQAVALQLSCGIDFQQALTADTAQKSRIISKLNRLIQRERLKGLNKHWSYDINRHIALKQVRDRLINMIPVTYSTSLQPETATK